MGAQSAALDYANTGQGVNWPADSKIKTGHEYVQRLVKEGVFKVGDLKIFTTSGQIPARSFEDITPEHIGFRIANVSESDPSDTIFLVTPNFLDNTPYPFVDYRTWWQRLWPFSHRPRGFVIFRKGGDGSFYQELPGDLPSKIIGILPPREPKFLEP